MTNHRDAITGEFVTAEHAATNPNTTVSESRDDLAAELRRLRGVNHTLTGALDGANVKIVELEANLDHLRTEDIPVIQQRRDELIARVAELEGRVEVEYAGRNRLAAMVRSVRAFCEAFVEGSEDRDPEPWNPAAYVLAILDGDPGANSNSKTALGDRLEVRTVGDLTARHIGKRVRVGKTPPATLAGLSWREVGIRVHLVTTDAEAVWQNLPLNTPVEVLG